MESVTWTLDSTCQLRAAFSRTQGPLEHIVARDGGQILTPEEEKANWTTWIDQQSQFCGSVLLQEAGHSVFVMGRRFGRRVERRAGHRPHSC